MRLKQALLDCLLPAQLKDICNELEIAADRRSQLAMVEALSSARTARPEWLLRYMSVEQLRNALELLELPQSGRKEELVERLLGSDSRGSGSGRAIDGASTEGKTPIRAGTSFATGRGRVDMNERTEQYRHLDKAVQRPDVGVQDQFQTKKPPRTYRYDSSLDPTMSWDENRERDLGEWLIGLIEQAATKGEKNVFAETQEWKGGGVRVASIADAIHILKGISKAFLNWSGKAERHQITVPSVPLFVHERHSTKAILDGIRHRKARGSTLDLFGDPQMDIRENLEAYEHKGPWQNRMILGDSLGVMNSLLEFEGLGGQVQMIYIDPPYGVNYGSNFQPFVRKRKVSSAGDEDMTREPEMVKAYRDTWELGLHSYLTYLRDRLLIARELLNETGSLFVQISDENVHHVRALLDETFGAHNFFAQINFKSKQALGQGGLASVYDYILWYARDRERMKFHPAFEPKGISDDKEFRFIDDSNSQLGYRRLTEAEFDALPSYEGVFRRSTLTSSGFTTTCTFEFDLQGTKCKPFGGKSWRTTRAGIQKLIEKSRLFLLSGSPYFKLYYTDYPFTSLENSWTKQAAAGERLYVVQTGEKFIQRCMLMTTDPGDLVLDPTCGSGTTAYVAEQWGRRWITIDTSRVPLALARQRLLTATYPYYELKASASGPAGGFVYKRKQNRKGEEVGGLVPHITLKCIANDEPPATEVLVDRPEELSGVTRVSGPFVVEATIAPVQPIEEDGDGERVPGDVATHLARMTEVLRQSKTLRLPGNRELTFAGIRQTVDAEYLHAEAKDGNKRVAIVFGPQDGAVSASLVYEAAREAHYLKYDQIYFFGFAVEPNARIMIEEEKKLRIPASYVAVTPDVAMSDLLKTSRSSEIFSVTGLPDIDIRRSKKKGADGALLYEVELAGLDLADSSYKGPLCQHRNRWSKLKPG